MNAARRKIITALQAEISAIIDQISNLRDDIEEVLTEEQEAFDSLPESLQNSDRGQASYDAIGQIEAALDYLDNTGMSEAHDALDEAKA